MARAAWCWRAPAREEALNDAILERMEGNHHKPATSPQQPLGGGKTLCELLELLVDVKTKRLEGARRRVLGFATLAAEHPCHDVGELLRSLDGFFDAPRHDGFGNRARAALF